MTKKAVKIYNTYCNKLNTEVFMYEQHIIDFSKLQENLHEEQENFQNMVIQMYHYNLLNDEDFSKLFNKAHSTQNEVIDKILGITV